MFEEFSYFSAFLVGLMSGVHCIGMCGGIVSAISMSRQQQVQSSMGVYIRWLLAYNTGRLISYTLAGALMGGVGWIVSYWSAIRELQLGLQLFAAIIMILLGLYISGWWMILVHVEKMGAMLWRYLEPLGKNFLPLKNQRQALMLGLFWGWLPCGLVYSVLIWAIASGSFWEGALLMLFFGLGTLPNLLAMGMFASQLRQWVAKKWLRQLAGGTIISFGVWGVYLVAVA